MTGKALTSCPQCRLSHPTPGPFCPFRSGPSPAPSFGSGGPSRQTIFTHSGKPVCRIFNTGSCDSTQCTRVHVCFSCRGNHSAHSCHMAKCAIRESMRSPHPLVDAVLRGDGNCFFSPVHFICPCQQRGLSC